MMVIAMPDDKILPPEAKRALAEAEARRRRLLKPGAPVEVGGPNGPEPTRYGDWEVKGLATDF
jgi:hypothetical protein